jgi:glycosyltransferase involved in cell wall biosynthesis
VREILEHGVTGFIVRNEAEAAAAVARVGTLDRRRIRSEFERRFTARRMARDYLNVYRRLGAKDRPAVIARPRPVAGVPVAAVAEAL